MLRACLSTLGPTHAPEKSFNNHWGVPLTLARMPASSRFAVIEIGTGWGGFALHAARHYGAHVTTTTISREQHALASQRVAEAGLQDRVTLLLQDYRDLLGQYDKLVSIEMIEAFEEVSARILEAIHSVLERTPPELVADISTNGIVMTGGGSLVCGFDKLIESHFTP